MLPAAPASWSASREPGLRWSAQRDVGRAPGCSPAPAALQLHADRYVQPERRGSGRPPAASGCSRRPVHASAQPTGQHGIRRGIPEHGGRRLGRGDVADVLAAHEQAIASGLCSEHAPAVAGSSYGGFLGACLLVGPARLAAAVLGAPVTDLASFAQTTDAGSSRRTSSERSRTPTRSLAGLASRPRCCFTPWTIGAVRCSNREISCWRSALMAPPWRWWPIPAMSTRLDGRQAFAMSSRGRWPGYQSTAHPNARR
jgi:hypothetical protein